jgi:uncharacterized protein YdeI (YjbR/CyaY-like superfamily)
MAKKDPRIDAYIAKSAKFARPILKHLRALVHEGCPDVVETVKWGMPHFDYEGVLCGMAAFKEHCAFGFWNRALKIPGRGGAMGQFGCIKSLADLPGDKVLVGYVREAARLNAAGEKVGPVRRERKPLPVPPELSAALKKNAAARARFESFSSSQKRDYSEWIGEAKQDATRRKRTETAVGWIAEGKPRNWKYMRKPAGGASKNQG